MSSFIADSYTAETEDRLEITKASKKNVALCWKTKHSTSY